MSATQLDMESAIVCCAPVAATRLTDDEVEATARLFRAIGDPARIRILNALATNAEPVCVCNLIEPLGLTQPTVSHHLKTLADAGLLIREQRGKWAYFSLKPEAATRLADLLDFKGCC
jgi:ArsR family transcriptional regulator, arsenate/arsenite/antimonite-responsive transcriptional repressor